MKPSPPGPGSRRGAGSNSCTRPTSRQSASFTIIQHNARPSAIATEQTARTLEKRLAVAHGRRAQGLRQALRCAPPPCPPAGTAASPSNSVCPAHGFTPSTSRRTPRFLQSRPPTCCCAAPARRPIKRSGIDHLRRREPALLDESCGRQEQFLVRVGEIDRAIELQRIEPARSQRSLNRW